MSFVIVRAALAFLMFAAYRGYSVILSRRSPRSAPSFWSIPPPSRPCSRASSWRRWSASSNCISRSFCSAPCSVRSSNCPASPESIVAARDSLHRPLPRQCGDRRGVRAAHLRRRLAVRRGVRGVPVRRGAVSPEQYSEAPDARRHRTRRILVHDGFAAGHAANSEHHPDDVLQDDVVGRARAGRDRLLFIIVAGLTYLEWRRRSAMATGEGYGTELVNEPERVESKQLPHPLLAIAPLVLVGVANFFLTR